jgi:hypothetical protein
MRSFAITPMTAPMMMVQRSAVMGERWQVEGLSGS